MTTTSERPPQQRINTRVPPHSREAEISVLGGILLTADSAHEVMDRLVPEDFYVPSHQSIFESMLALYNSSEPIDAVTVSEELRRRGFLDKVGGITYLTGLIDMVPGVANIAYYAGIVEEHGLRRSLIKSGGAITEMAFHTEEEISNVLDRAEQNVLGVAEKRSSNEMTYLGPLFSEVMGRISEMDGSNQVTGLPTGLKDLDRLLGGLHPSNLVVVAARPSMGKSALALNMATNVAMKGKTVAIFSLEMSKEEIVQRMLCSVGRIDSKAARTGTDNERIWKAMTDAADKLFQAPMFVDDSSVVNVTDIRAKCRRVERVKGLDLVIVDYLQLMQGNHRENRQQEIAEISRGLKNLASELKVPIIAVSQLNRSAEQREDKRPRLSDLRESGALEQDADIVMFIYRDEYYNRETPEAKGVAEVNVAKHRSGETGTVKMTFLSNYTLFTDMGRDLA